MSKLTDLVPDGYEPEEAEKVLAFREIYIRVVSELVLRQSREWDGRPRDFRFGESEADKEFERTCEAAAHRAWCAAEIGFGEP